MGLSEALRPCNSRRRGAGDRAQHRFAEGRSGSTLRRRQSGPLRGIYLDQAVLDEYAQMREGVWSEVIRPALADRQGGATFIGTPMGRNAFAQLWDRAKVDPT